MKPYFVEISDDAICDIKSIGEYIFDKSPQNSVDFIVELYKTIENLEYFPDIWKNLDNGVQARVYKNHYILYDIDKNKRLVEILRIVHVSNFPEYQDLF